jgi:hypothetical protein
MAERERYEHRPDAGETRYPPESGEQRGPHEPGERDPHHPLNVPLDELPEPTPGQSPHIRGMNGRPPARGERVADEPLPPPDE